LGEVEAALAACATVAQAVAALRPDGRLLGYVVPVTGAAVGAPNPPSAGPAVLSRYVLESAPPPAPPRGPGRPAPPRPRGRP
ncbi:hypothetical protein, partial [Nocardia abscessus]|uniref:hypothetical protein n=1 Tax=Nocardia abscessus TaxID=120957 RepID=UPI0024588E0D